MLQQARSEIAIWRWDYSEMRPHGNLGQMLSAEYAQFQNTKSQPQLNRTGFRGGYLVSDT